jgi:hypothetical protein
MLLQPLETIEQQNCCLLEQHEKQSTEHATGWFAALVGDADVAFVCA